MTLLLTTVDGIPAIQHTTVPSLVSSQGHHLSYSLPQHHQSIRRDISQDYASGRDGSGRVYIKLAAFGETLYLNLTLSSWEWGTKDTPVDYVQEDGSVETLTKQRASCYYAGHIQRGEGEGEAIGRVMEGSWTAVSTCNGLVRIV